MELELCTCNRTSVLINTLAAKLWQVSGIGKFKTEVLFIKLNYNTISYSKFRTLGDAFPFGFYIWSICVQCP